MTMTAMKRLTVARRKLRSEGAVWDIASLGALCCGWRSLLCMLLVGELRKRAWS